MTDASGHSRYELLFLTDQWEWRDTLDVANTAAAKAAAREALETLVRTERPELACVTLVLDGHRLGVWDWVEARPFWTPL